MCTGSAPTASEHSSLNCMEDHFPGHDPWVYFYFFLAWRFDFYTSQNDFHDKFSEHPSSHIDTKLKKFKNMFALWSELLGFTPNFHI